MVDFFSSLMSVVILNRDEYKEFEKLIQEDLQEVDARMEEEEVGFFIFF